MSSFSNPLINGNSLGADMDHTVFRNLDLFAGEEVRPTGAPGQIYIPLIGIFRRDGRHQKIIAEQEFVIDAIGLDRKSVV